MEKKMKLNTMIGHQNHYMYRRPSVPSEPSVPPVPSLTKVPKVPKMPSVSSKRKSIKA